LFSPQACTGSFFLPQFIEGRLAVVAKPALSAAEGTTQFPMRHWQLHNSIFLIVIPVKTGIQKHK
jgi:hypothetical protein